MTKKLFYEDPYICEAKCEVEEIVGKADKFEIVLKSTPFYPEGGGQPSDLGTIDGIKVEYVYEKDDIIYHVMASKPIEKLVNCKVDFERRVDHIQQHSGEHLLSAAFFKLYKVSNAGFHLGENYVTIDIELKDVTEEMIKKVENEANSYIFKNEPVKTYFMTKEEANKLPLRKAIKAEGNIRMVEMGEGTDYSACCGTHVKFTGEVGTIKIIKFEKNKGMTRIYMICGWRALKDYQAKFDLITEIAKKFSVEASEVVNKVKGQRDEIIELKNQLSKLYGQIALKEAVTLETNANSNFIISEYKEEGFDFLEKLYDSLKEKQYILLLSSLKDKKLILAQNGSFDINCGKLFKENLKEYNGKGGGNDKRAQANFEDKDSLEKFLDFLKNRIVTAS